jgi:hypothetical protein
MAYYENARKCQKCRKELPYEKRHNRFCGQSCAASVRNQGVRRHGKAPNSCQHCGQLTKSSAQQFCSTECFISFRQVHCLDENYKKRMNAQRQSKYRAKKYRTLAADADPQKVKEIYLNCPDGYEVDHIIPVSKGGKHHEDNLQYLPIAENRRKRDKII